MRFVCTCNSAQLGRVLLVQELGTIGLQQHVPGGTGLPRLGRLFDYRPIIEALNAGRALANAVPVRRLRPSCTSLEPAWSSPRLSGRCCVSCQPCTPQSTVGLCHRGCLLLPDAALHRFQLFLGHPVARRKVPCREASSEKVLAAAQPEASHTGIDLCINLYSRVGRDQRLGELNPLVDGDTVKRASSASAAAPGRTAAWYSPLSHDGVVFHAKRRVMTRQTEKPKRARLHTTHLLMLSILSIFAMPSQCRISGISAWKRMSLTPAMFSVRLK